MFKINTKFGALNSLAIAGFMGACSVGASQGAIVATITEAGGVVTYSSAGGTLDLTGMSLSINSGLDAFFSGTVNVVGGIGVSEAERFQGGTAVVSAGWTSTGTTQAWTTTSGTAGIAAAFDYQSTGPALWIADDAGTAITASVETIDSWSHTFTGSIAGSGLTANESVIYTLASGDTFTIQTAALVPEPSSALLASAGLGLLALRRKRKSNY